MACGSKLVERWVDARAAKKPLSRLAEAEPRLVEAARAIGEGADIDESVVEAYLGQGPDVGADA